MGLEVSKVLFIIWFVICLPAFALADPIIYTGGVKGGTTAFSVKPKVLTTDGGVSVWTVLPDKNLVYAMIPRAMYESGANDVNRNMGSAAFSGFTGWYHDPATGLLTHYAANEIPFEEHAGIYTVSLASATTNYIVESEDFTSAGWAKVRSFVTNFGTAPDGTESAYFHSADGADSTHYLKQNIPEGVITNNSIVTLSAFVEPDTRTWYAFLILTKTEGTLTAYFDLTNGVVGSTSGTSSIAISEQTYNGAYRISMTWMSDNSDSGVSQIRLHLAEGDNDVSFQGDATGATVWGVMLSETPSAHPYLPTEGSIAVWAGNAGALTYSLDTMKTALDGTTPALSGTSLWGEQLGAERHTLANATSDPNGNEANAKTGWSNWGTPITFESGNTDPNVGAFHFGVDADKSGDGMARNSTTVVANVLYKISYDVQVNSGAIIAQFRNSAFAIIAPNQAYNNAAWESYSVYVSPVDTTFILIFSSTEASDFYVDNVSVKPVLNAWDSGDGDGLEPPHFTLIQAVRHTYNRAEVPADATNHGYITTRNDSTGTLIYRYQNGISLVSFDGTTAAQAAIDIVAHSWSWLVLEVGKLNSNVSQFRLCEISGGLSCGAWADYDGDYSVAGSNLHYFFSGFGYIHFGPLLIYRSHLDSTFYDQLGNGG